MSQTSHLTTVGNAGYYAKSRTATPSLRRRLATLRRLSAEQETLKGQGQQALCSRARLGRELRFSRATMERIDLTCRLRFLQALARQDPQALIEMGASPRQLNFLQTMRLSPGQARRLWQRWGRLGGK
jgi:hypothetical protein